jgi:pilus assembly protein Flp/PilA
MLKYLTPALLYIQARLGHDDRGATAVEYGLIVAAIAAVIITVVITLGADVAAAFTKVTSAWP